MKKRIFEFRYDVSSGELISGFQQVKGVWSAIYNCELEDIFEKVIREGKCLGGAQEEKFISETWSL